MLFTMAVALVLPISADDRYRAQGFEILDQIRRDYYLPKSKLYCDSIDISSQGKIKQSGPAFNWGVGVMLSALNAAAKLNPKYKNWLREFADATRVYWNRKGPVPGYDVLPGPKPVDRYYDDNAWMVLALVETYEILGDKKYLDWASKALDYVLSGEDSKLGGGIYWRESDKKSKNACSNAPSAAACLAVARHRRTPELLGKAKQLLDWTQSRLQDPSDLLIWDNISLTGKIDKTKWTYNAGLFLRASAMLDKVGVIDNSNLVRMVKTSKARWVDPATGAIRDTGRFAHLWLAGLLAASAVLKSDVQGKTTRNQALDYLLSKCRNPQGRFGPMWDRPFDPKQKKFELIDQASVARALLFHQ